MSCLRRNSRQTDLLSSYDNDEDDDDELKVPIDDIIGITGAFSLCTLGRSYKPSALDPHGLIVS